MTTPSTPLRSFLSWPAGASLLYLVSAACLLGGAALVLAPGSGDEGRIVERIALLGTVEVYLAAIVGLAALVCFWKPGNGDAVALLVLMALFVPGMNAGLSTIATHRPAIALSLGIVGLALAVGYALFIQKRVTGSWGWQVLAPLGALQVWHALAPGVLGLAYANSAVPEFLLSVWLPGWWLVVVSGMALVLSASRAAPSATDLGTVKSTGLRWMLATGAVVAGGLHQWLLTYSLSLGLNGWDLLALIVIVLLLIDVLLRCWTCAAPGLLPVFEVVAGIIGIIIARSGNFTADASSMLSMCCYPPLILAIGGTALLGIAWRFGDRGSLVSGSGWLLGSILTWGTTASHEQTNLRLVAAVLFVVLSFILVCAPHRRWMWLVLLVVLCVGTIHADWGPALIAAAAVIGRSIRTRTIAVGCTSLAPLLVHGGGWIPDALSAGGGWLAVGAAFALLGGGAWVSWRRTQASASGFPQPPAA